MLYKVGGVRPFFKNTRCFVQIECMSFYMFCILYCFIDFVNLSFGVAVKIICEKCLLEHFIKGLLICLGFLFFF